MAKSIINGDIQYSGTIEFTNSVDLPAGSVVNADVSASAAIGAEKQEHQYAVSYYQPSGTAIVAEDAILHIARGAGTVVAAYATIETSPTGADRTVNIDIEKGNASTGFATVLTGDMQIVDATADRELITGTLSGTPTIAAGDYIRVDVSVAGAAGNQAQGLCVTVFIREAAD